MFFSSKIEIDPTQITQVSYSGKKSIIGQALQMLKGASKEELETFTAISILEQIYDGLVALDLKNVIRLAVDDFDYFFDKDSVDDDLLQAVNTVRYNIDPMISKHFDNIFLVLEAKDEFLKYVIEIRIKRKHKVGEYPIKIHINALFNEFYVDLENAQEQEDALRAKLNELFKSQLDYDIFVQKRFIAYEQFVKKFFFELGKFIKVDAIKHMTDRRIIRPQKRIFTSKEIDYNNSTFSIFYGYKGFREFFLYCWLWADYCYNYNIHLSNVKFIDSHGFKIFAISDIGFNSKDYPTLNLDLDFIPPQSAFVKFYSKNQYNDKLISISKHQFDETYENFGESFEWLNNDGVDPNLKMRVLRTKRDY